MNHRGLTVQRLPVRHNRTETVPGTHHLVDKFPLPVTQQQRRMLQAPPQRLLIRQLRTTQLLPATPHQHPTVDAIKDGPPKVKLLAKPSLKEEQPTIYRVTRYSKVTLANNKGYT